MSIANKFDFAKYPTITVLSQQDLEEKYRQEHPSWSPWLPSPLSLVKFYIEKEKPQHVMVDEAPFEKSTWKQLLTLQIWIFHKLVSFFGQMGFLLLVAIWILLAFPPLLYGGFWWAVITLGVLLTWFFAEYVVNPFSLDKTGSLLDSLHPLLPSSSSFLWLAMHSSPLTDNTGGGRGNLSKEKLNNWRSRWTTTFTIPTLKHNLRNSHEVAKVTGLEGRVTFYSSQTKALPTAPAPRPLPTLPSTPFCQPTLLHLYSTSQLREAVKHAYVKGLEEPGTLVVLLDDLNQLDVVKTSLAQESLSVVTYTKPKERTSCKKFLENPVGALITTSQLFSGMEAANIIWVRDPNKDALQRSSQLRAIHKLCVIDTESNFARMMEVSTGVKADGTFAKCHKTWLGELFWCKSCNSQPILLCRHCAAVCHQSCERGEADFKTFLHWILQYNPCSCKTSGCCKLKPPTRSLLQHALHILSAIAVGILCTCGVVVGVPLAIVFGVISIFKKL